MTRQEAKDMLQPGVVLEFMRGTHTFSAGDCLKITHIRAFNSNSLHGVFTKDGAELRTPCEYRDPDKHGWGLNWIARKICNGTVRIKEELSIADQINKIVDEVLNDV